MSLEANERPTIASEERLRAIREAVGLLMEEQAEDGDGSGGVLSRMNEFDESIFDKNDAVLKAELVRIVVQYLEQEGFVASALTLADESSLKKAEAAHAVEHRAEMRRALLDGDWNAVKQLCVAEPFKHYRAFLYEVHKQSPDAHVSVSNELRDQLAQTLSEDRSKIVREKPAG